MEALCANGADPNALVTTLSPDQEGGEPEWEVPILFGAIEDRYGDRAPTIATLLQAGATPVVTNPAGDTPSAKLVEQLCDSQRFHKRWMKRFWKGIPPIDPGTVTHATTRDVFVGEVLPVYRSYIAEFCSGLAPDAYEQYGLPQKRRDICEAITLLLAYEAWFEGATAKPPDRS